MHQLVNAGPGARRFPVPGALRRRLRLPRRITIYLAILDLLARTFDLSNALRRARRGPWRAEVAETSMAPALLPGDWLLLDPTCRRWPRPGTVVVVREPGTGILAIKRVAARGRAAGRPGSPPVVRLASGDAHPLGSREAWLLGDAGQASLDSRRYGPLDADDLVARAWLRYGPPSRIGRLR